MGRNDSADRKALDRDPHQVINELVADAGSVALLDDDPNITTSREADLGRWWFGEIVHSDGAEHIDVVSISGTSNGVPFTFSRQFRTGMKDVLLPERAIEALETPIETDLRVGTTNAAYEAALRGDMNPANKMAAEQMMDRAEMRENGLFLVKVRRQYRFLKDRELLASDKREMLGKAVSQ